MLKEGTSPAFAVTESQVKAAVKYTDYEFRLFQDYIHDYCGIFFDDAKAETLMSRLTFRMKLLGIDAFMEYYNYLRFNPRAAEEAADLIPHLTNNETYFFRELSQLGFLVERLKEKAAGFRQGGGKLRILSCGCSSGEEAYTLSILLDEAGVYDCCRGIEIIGLDIDRKVVDKARLGEYTGYSLRATDNPRIDKYFSHSGDKYVLKDSVKERVRFRLGNLLDPETYSGFDGLDAVICRNVFIYFSDSAIRRIVESFHGCLSDTGYLLLGHSESLTRITDIFYPKRHPGVIVYSKKDL